MRQMTNRIFLQTLGLICFIMPLTVFGQAKNGAPAGWGANWIEPANDQQRRQQEFVRQCEAARKAHNYQGIVEICNRAVQKDPQNAGVYAIRAGAYAELKQFDRAVTDVDHAREIVQKNHLPDASAKLLIVRAMLNERRSDYVTAVNDLQTSLKLNEKNALAWNNLAWLKATAPDNTIRNGRESVRMAKKAVSLSTQNSYASIDTLAAAYAEANDYPQAVESEKRAMSLAEKEIKDSTLAQKFQKEAAERLHLFEQHQPYRAVVLANN